MIMLLLLFYCYSEFKLNILWKYSSLFCGEWRWN